MEPLPLFPLGSVLLPGAPLALQVFEPRYVQLMHDLLGEGARTDGVPPEFGVVAIRRGFEVGEGIRDTHDVGTVARIEQIGLIGAGVFGVVAVGAQRFHLRVLDETGSTPYLTGLVERLDEPVGDPQRAAVLARELVVAVGLHLDARGEDLAEQGQAPDDPTGVSYWAPRVLELEPQETQVLLAAPDTVTRLSMTLRTIRRETQIEDRLGVTQAPRQAPPSNLN
ncbi:MAG: LON peptidase substrate-binding domain-containing protein [Actinomycetota bacterium]|nr:LON peptidase substrate-binding domain-containing protein [Actinomycetota bacterium]